MSPRRRSKQVPHGSVIVLCIGRGDVGGGAAKDDVGRPVPCQLGRVVGGIVVVRLDIGHRLVAGSREDLSDQEGEAVGHVGLVGHAHSLG